MEAESFFTVWCEDGGTPTVKHPDVCLAQAEARRLAKMNPNRRFWVMESLGYMQIEDPCKWTPADRVTCAPF